jgi:hypothetical protein
MKQNIRHIAFWRVWTIALLLTFTAQQVALAQSPLGEETKQPRMALRTNLLYDATLSPNLGVDVRVDSAWTVGLLVGINAWDIDKTENKKWRHALFSLRARKYRDSLFHKGYFEGDLIYSHYNVGNVKFPFGLYKSVKDRRLQGDLVALGGKYGYSWILARHWRIEAEAGVAVGYAWFKEYDCDHCGTYYGKGDRIFLLPQLGINVVYIIN